MSSRPHPQGVATVPIVAIDHVQLAMPPGGEDAARRFYRDVLQLDEVAKPSVLAGRDGVWFRAAAVQLHLAVEADFRPARKAHPALRVVGLADFVARCAAAGVPITRDVPLPGRERAHIADPFGNRIELVELADTETGAWPPLADGRTRPRHAPRGAAGRCRSAHPRIRKRGHSARS
jgi:catechol 2,3-dioxygenase-like lactoylglutathione lyase family enzyme